MQRKKLKMIIVFIDSFHQELNFQKEIFNLLDYLLFL